MKLKKKNLQIAIDGPVASGKSSGAFLLAKKLGILYIYTGAMYRAAAWIGLKNGLDLQDENALYDILKKSKIELKPPTKKNRVCDVFINGKDVTHKLFSSKIHIGSSRVSVYPSIRKYLVKIQKDMAKNRAVVMEGRDTTSVVLPSADLKVYMKANLIERAKRRLKELKKRGEKNLTLKKVIESIKKRDSNDIHNKKFGNLQIVPDAWILDTSNLTIKEEIDMIINKLKELDLIE